MAGFPTTYNDRQYVSELDWPDIFFDAVQHWLLGRFFMEERYNLFLVVPPASCVRLSSEVARFELGSGDGTFHDLQDFPREPEALAMLAMGGFPFNYMFPPPFYFVRVEDVPKRITNFGDIISQQLAPMNGALLAWKARLGETPHTVLTRLLSELTLFAEGESDAATRSDDSLHRLQIVLEEIWQAFPQGKRTETWANVTKRSGHSRRQIERAFKMYGGRDKWAEAGK